MRALFWLLTLLALAVAVALLAQNEGFVLFILPPWRMDISLNLFIFLFFVSFALCFGLFRAVQFSLSLPKRARIWRAQREEKQARDAVEEALRLLFAGRYGHAIRAAERAWQAGQLAGTAAIIAARAAQRMRETEKVSLWLERARATGTEMEIATGMIGAEMALEQGDYTGALEHLRELQHQHGRHIAAMRLELKSLQGTGNMPAVLKLVRQLEKRGGMGAAVGEEIRRKAHREALRQHEGDPEQLLAYFQALPKEEQTPRLALDAARSLARAHAPEAAAEILETALDTEYLPELVTLYGQLPAEPGRALIGRIACAENWLEKRPYDTILLISLGLLCEKQKLWGKARSYLEASLAITPSRAAHLALARLLDTLEEPDAANQHYRRAADIEAGYLA
ncbi:MAG: heme biosynthesis protein HemY [Zoogloeaceae bacterium]|jgi:HemY protein|nr:heme biosynthesis protein HemY [Zoogloeaceae bacterium]